MPINLICKNGNLRNMTPADLDKSIYRIVPVKNNLDLMLENKTLALAKTSSWEDVYENFFFKENFFVHGDKVTMEHLADNIFGQCWSTFKDSDAMWRIYSYDKKSVRIKTTIRKLFDAVYLSDHCMATTYIGAIDYKSQKALNEWIDSINPVSTSDLTKVTVDSLFMKRNNFSHEQEIRVIYQPDSASPDCSSRLKFYSIDTDDFLEEIAFDPRADDTFMQDTMRMISKHGYPMSRVIKSPLYDFKKANIELL